MPFKLIYTHNIVYSAEKYFLKMYRFRFNVNHFLHSHTHTQPHNQIHPLASVSNKNSNILKTFIHRRKLYCKAALKSKSPCQVRLEESSLKCRDVTVFWVVTLKNNVVCSPLHRYLSLCCDR